MNRLACIAVASAVVLLAACKKDPPPAPPPPKVAAKPATPPPEVRTNPPPGEGPQRRTDLPEPPPPPPISVEQIALGKFIGPDKKVDLAAGPIQPSDKLFASVDTQGAGEVMIKVRWSRIADGKATLITEGAKGVKATGPMTHVFEVHNAEGWKPGDYQVEILVNDRPAATRRFGV